jgi:excisionase family DNA binding protein
VFGDIRSIVKDGEIWFVAKDVCRCLGLTHTTKALSNIDEDERGVQKVHTFGGMQEMMLISESGLYRLMMRSNKPEAVTFQKVIAKEVIPSIRKNGGYMLPQVQQDLKYDSFLGDRIIKLGELVNKREQAQQERYNTLVGRAKVEETITNHYRQIANDQQKLLDKKTIRLGDVEKYIRMKMGSVVQPEYLGTNEVARRLNVSRRTVQNLVNDSEHPLPVVRVKGCVRVKTTDLDKWIKKCKNKGFAGE